MHVCVTLCVGEKYATANDLIEALLAYNIAISDIDTDTSQLSVQQLPTPLQQQQQQQQQQVTPAAETTTTSCFRQRHVGCDVTDDATSSPVTCKRREYAAVQLSQHRVAGQ